MPLSPGSTLGPYQITAPLGAGGMGEVYRARDTTLDRDVAIKVLPDAFAADAERLARFEHEVPEDRSGDLDESAEPMGSLARCASDPTGFLAACPDPHVKTPHGSAHPC